MQWVAVWLCALAGSGCVSAYRPVWAPLPVRLPADAWERVLAVVRARYPRLVVAEERGFRIQSDWIPHERAGKPGQRRATLFVDPPGRINVVVETRYLGLDLLGDPRWSSVRGDPRLERELLEALLAALR